MRSFHWPLLVLGAVMTFATASLLETGPLIGQEAEGEKKEGEEGVSQEPT